MWQKRQVRRKCFGRENYYVYFSDVKMKKNLEFSTGTEQYFKMYKLRKREITVVNWDIYDNGGKTVLNIVLLSVCEEILTRALKFFHISQMTITVFSKYRTPIKIQHAFCRIMMLSCLTAILYLCTFVNWFWNLKISYTHWNICDRQTNWRLMWWIVIAIRCSENSTIYTDNFQPIITRKTIQQIFVWVWLCVRKKVKYVHHNVTVLLFEHLKVELSDA